MTATSASKPVSAQQLQERVAAVLPAQMPEAVRQRILDALIEGLLEQDDA